VAPEEGDFKRSVGFSAPFFFSTLHSTWITSPCSNRTDSPGLTGSTQIGQSGSRSRLLSHSGLMLQAVPRSRSSSPCSAATVEADFFDTTRLQQPAWISWSPL
jgi:hypothetical protein